METSQMCPIAASAFGAVAAVLVGHAAGKQLTSLVAAAARGAAQGAMAGPAAHVEGGGDRLLLSMEEVLQAVGSAAGRGGKPSLTAAKELLKQEGPQGSALASRVGRLSKARNTAGHPDLGLIKDIYTLLEGRVQQQQHRQHLQQLQSVPVVDAHDLEEKMNLVNEQAGTVGFPAKKLNEHSGPVVQQAPDCKVAQAAMEGKFTGLDEVLGVCVEKARSMEEKLASLAKELVQTAEQHTLMAQREAASDVHGESFGSAGDQAKAVRTDLVAHAGMKDGHVKATPDTALVDELGDPSVPGERSIVSWRRLSAKGRFKEPSEAELKDHIYDFLEGLDLSSTSLTDVFDILSISRVAWTPWTEERTRALVAQFVAGSTSGRSNAGSGCGGPACAERSPAGWSKQGVEGSPTPGLLEAEAGPVPSQAAVSAGGSADGASHAVVRRPAARAPPLACASFECEGGGPPGLWASGVEITAARCRGVLPALASTA